MKTFVYRRVFVRSLLVVLLAAPLRGDDSFGPLLTQIKTTTIIPAEVIDHTMFVMVTINGAGPFRMLVDTGCTCTVVAPATAARIADPDAVKPLPTEAAVNGAGDLTMIAPLHLLSVSLDRVSFDDVPAAIADAFAVPSQVVGHRIDGALGFSLFEDLVVTLDFPHRQLILSSGTPDGLPPVRATLPLHMERNVPSVETTLQGRPLLVEIDTGSNLNLQLSDDIAEQYTWCVPPRPGGLVSVFDETIHERLGRLEGELLVGGVRQLAPVAEISDGPASLGVQFLGHYCLVFDQPHRTLELRSDNGGNVASPPARTLGLSLLEQDDGWRVADVMPDSPASALGIASGDLIVQLESQPATDWTRDEINLWIEGHDTLSARLVHAGTAQDKVLPIWSLIP